MKRTIADCLAWPGRPNPNVRAILMDVAPPMLPEITRHIHRMRYDVLNVASITEPKLAAMAPITDTRQKSDASDSAAGT